MTTTRRTARNLDRLATVIRYFTGFAVPVAAAAAIYFGEVSSYWLSAALLMDSVAWRITGIVVPMVRRMREDREAAPHADDFYNYS